MRHHSTPLQCISARRAFYIIGNFNEISYCIKKSAYDKRTRLLIIKPSYCSICSVRTAYSLRLAPSVIGVAVASQILCISTTLNKRISPAFLSDAQYGIFISAITIHQLHDTVNGFYWQYHGIFISNYSGLEKGLILCKLFDLILLHSSHKQEGHQHGQCLCDRKRQPYNPYFAVSMDHKHGKCICHRDHKQKLSAHGNDQ